MIPNNNIVSNNLQITDVKFTGLSFTDLFLDPFLNKGTMCASFNSMGTMPSIEYWRCTPMLDVGVHIGCL